MKKLKLELTHLYLPVSFVLAILLLLFRGQSKLQFEVVCAGALIYLGISLSHHHFDRSLTMEVMLEYILIDALSLVILQQFLV
jgi:hypothetical protein